MVSAIPPGCGARTGPLGERHASTQRSATPSCTVDDRLPAVISLLTPRPPRTGASVIERVAHARFAHRRRRAATRAGATAGGRPGPAKHARPVRRANRRPSPSTIEMRPCGSRTMGPRFASAWSMRPPSTPPPAASTTSPRPRSAGRDPGQRLFEIVRLGIVRVVQAMRLGCGRAPRRIESKSPTTATGSIPASRQSTRPGVGGDDRASRARLRLAGDRDRSLRRPARRAARVGASSAASRRRRAASTCRDPGLRSGWRASRVPRCYGVRRMLRLEQLPRGGGATSRATTPPPRRWSTSST